MSLRAHTDGEYNRPRLLVDLYEGRLRRGGGLGAGGTGRARMNRETGRCGPQEPDQHQHDLREELHGGVLEREVERPGTRWNQQPCHARELPRNVARSRLLNGLSSWCAQSHNGVRGTARKGRGYSSRSVVAGSIRAARQACTLTERNAIPATSPPAPRKSHGPRSMR